MLGLALACACACAAAPAEDDGAGESSSAGEVPDGPCVPGQSVACGCGGGAMGAAVCRDDGSGYDDCRCDGDDAPGTSPSGSGADTDAGSGADADSDADSDPDSGLEESSDVTGSEEVSFERDIKPILVVSCGGMTDTCHSRVAYAATASAGCRGWFSFEDAALGSVIYAGPTIGQTTGCPDMPLYDRLLQLNSWQCDPEGRPVVSPGDPAGSYMLMKIDGIDLCPDGAVASDSMPPPGEGFGLPASSRAKLEAWILAGAPNN